MGGGHGALSWGRDCSALSADRQFIVGGPPRGRDGAGPSFFLAMNANFDKADHHLISLIKPQTLMPNLGADAVHEARFLYRTVTWWGQLCLR